MASGDGSPGACTRRTSSRVRSLLGDLVAHVVTITATRRTYGFIVELSMPAFDSGRPCVTWVSWQRQEPAVDDDPRQSHIPPIEPFPKARLGHPADPMRVPASAATVVWMVIGWTLLALMLLVVAAVGAYLLFGIQDRA
jgi:hypothetical protein